MTQIDVDAREVLERIDDGFFALDCDWRFTFLNERAAETLDVHREQVVGDVAWEVFEPAVGTAFQREYERAMESQEPVSFEEYYPPLEAWFQVDAYPSESGLSVYFRDVTARRERERELERYEKIVETTREGIYIVGDNGRFEVVNGAYAELVGYDREELLGEPPTKVAESETVREAAEIERELRAGERSVGSKEATLERADGRTVEVESTISTLPGGKRLGIVHDLTERKARKRELERVRDLLDRTERIADVGGWEVDTVTEEVFWTDHLFEMLGIDGDEEPPLKEALELYVDEDRPKIERAARRAMESGEPFDVEARFRRPDGETRWLRTRGVPITEDGDVVGLRGAAENVTERKEFERQLVNLHDVSRDLLRAGSDEEIAAISVDALREILDAPVAMYHRYDPGEGVLRPLEVADDEDDELDLSAMELDDRGLVCAAFRSGRTMNLDDIAESSRVADEADELDLRSGLVAPVGDDGVLGAAAPERAAFGGRVQQLVDIAAATASAALTKVDREQLLRQQRDRVVALKELNSLVHNLAESIFSLSEREDIERLVCERLQESDSYEFAWVGVVEDGAVTVATEAGVSNYLDDMDLSLDDPPGMEGPTVRAHLSGEMQVVRDVRTDPRYEPWRERAHEYGYRASAAVPIANGDDHYGTLNVYSARTDAFDDEERAALRRLGAIVAYAFSSAEHERKLHRERNRLEFMNRLLRHNLLNSLNVTEARLELLDGRVDYEAAGHLETAAERTREMIRFVETIRDTTDVIGRPDEHDPEPKPLDDVLTDRVESAQQSFPGARFHLREMPAVDVLADDLLGEVLDNVLTNAVQHNHSDVPTVRVDATVENDTVAVTVADNGPGIPDERKSSLFDSEVTEFDDPESGFGLYLTREILDSYDGSISVEDNDPEGSVFRLRFRRP